MMMTFTCIIWTDCNKMSHIHYHFKQGTYTCHINDIIERKKRFPNVEPLWTSVLALLIDDID